MIRRARVVIASLVVLSLFFNASVFAVNPNPKITKELQLKPDPQSEQIVDSISVTRLSDGSILVKGSGEHISGSEPVNFEWEVDLEKGTYKTTRIATEDVEGFGALSSGSHTAYVRVRTVDLPGLTLAETQQQLWWSVSNGKVYYNDRTKACWAVNPSPIGTRWYIYLCRWYNPIYYNGDQTRIYSEVEAEYYNYDWLDPNLITQASHFSRIIGRNNGGFDYSWFAYHSGESSGTLRGQVYAAGN